ncbi:MAG: hypothetical protein AAF657_09640 [Acidobacteriota bacterium]
MVLLSRKLTRVCLVGVFLSLAGTGQLLADPSADFALVPEMEEPQDVYVQSRSQRAALQESSEALRGLEIFRRQVRSLWPQLQQLDWEGLSRYQLEATQGWQLPAEPGELAGQVMGYDESARRWTLELRGPRLPARYDIVHRYVHLYGRFDPATGIIDQLTVTIRGWVLE